MSFEIHEFMCLNCGRLTMPLPRRCGFKRPKDHRKKLYCPFCKTECNCIEITNPIEKENFLELFKEGKFKEEAAASIVYVRSGN